MPFMVPAKAALLDKSIATVQSSITTMKPLILFAAVIAALLTVLSSRIVIPALILCFKAIEQSFAPEEPEVVPVLAAVPAPVTVSEVKPARKPRAARRRKPSAATLAKAQEALA